MTREQQDAFQKHIQQQAERIYFKNLSLLHKAGLSDYCLRAYINGAMEAKQWIENYIINIILTGNPADKVLNAACLKDHPELYTGSWCHKCNENIWPNDKCKFKGEPETQVFTMQDFNKGLMLAGLVPPANEQEAAEKKTLDEYEKSKSQKNHLSMKIVVFKDGTYIFVFDGITWEYENDNNWLVTIPIADEGGKIEAWVKMFYRPESNEDMEQALYKANVMQPQSGEPLLTFYCINEVMSSARCTTVCNRCKVWQ